MTNQEFQNDLCKINDFNEQENEKLKREFIESNNELQKQISKLQIENSKLTKVIGNNAQQQNIDIEQLNSKLSQLESKLNQETIKYEQKSREVTKNEKELQQLKSETTKLFEENNLCYSKILSKFFLFQLFQFFYIEVQFWRQKQKSNQKANIL